jgi:hypothetical protein
MCLAAHDESIRVTPAEYTPDDSGRWFNQRITPTTDDAEVDAS